MQVVTNFSLLGANLSKIYESECSKDPLVAFPGSLTLHKKNSLLGGFGSYIYKIVDIFTDKGSPGQENYTAQYLLPKIRKIHVVWQTASLEMQHLGKEYLSALAQEAPSAAVRSLRCQILSIADALVFLDVDSFDSRYAQKISVIQQFFSKVASLPFITAEVQEKLELFFESHALVFLEGTLQKPLPLNSFSLLLSGKEVDKCTNLTEWIIAVIRNQNTLTVGKLHQAMRGSIRTLFPDLDSKSEAFCNLVYRLEWELYKRGLHIFQKHDEAYLRWRDTLACSLQGDLRIGAKIDFPSSHALDVVFFEIEGDDSQALLCGNSPVQIGLWKVACEELAFGIQPLECTFKDPLGRFWIIKRVEIFLHDIKWSSPPLLEASIEKYYLQELVKVIKGLLRSQEGIPDFQNPERQVQFCFVKGHKLRVFPMLQQKASSGGSIEGPLFHELEAFCINLAKGNRYLLFSLMQRSGLASCHYAAVYTSIIRRQLLPSWWEKLLDGPKLRIAEEAALENIVDTEFVARAEALVLAFEETVKAILDIMKPYLRSKEEKGLREESIQMVLQFQEERGMCSQLHPDLLQKETLTALAFTVMMKKKEVFDTAAVQEAYQNSSSTHRQFIRG
jgi:hypothetical protein